MSPGTDHPANLSALSWDELRKLAHKVQDDVDQKLLSYTRLAQEPASPSQNAEDGPGSALVRDSAEALEREVDALLRRLGAITAAMADAAAAGTGGLAADKQLERHREILHDLEREHRKARAAVKSSRDRAELLSSVRTRISEHHDGAGALLRERAGLSHGTSEAMRVLQQAEEAKGRLDAQRTLLTNVGTSLETLTRRLPSINDVVARIQQKKKRDAIVLASVAAVCLFLIVLYLR